MGQQTTRRAVLRMLATGTTAMATAGSQTPVFPVTGTWTQHGGDAANTSETDDRGPKLGQYTRWRRSLPRIDSAPLMAGDTILLLEAGAETARVRGLYPSTGTTRFTVSAETHAVGGMLATDDSRVFTAGILKPRVSAFSLTDPGSREWTVSLSETDQSHTLALGDGFRTAPRVRNGRLYLKHRSSGPDRPGVIALQTETGAVETVYTGAVSSFAVGDELLVGARGSPTRSTHGLVVFDRETANRRHTYETTGRPGQPTISNRRLFVGTSANRLHAVSPTGKQLWTVETGSWPVTLAAGEKTVCVPTEEWLVAFDAETGTELWRVKAGTARPVIAAGLVYVGRNDGIDAYDLRSGSQEIEHRDIRFGGPVTWISVVRNTLLVSAARGFVAAVDEDLDLNLPVW